MTESKETIDLDLFNRLDLRIARILSAERVEGSSKLIRLRVSLGAEERTVFAGIQAHYAPEDLVDRLTVVIANLAPRKMRFGISEAMVLAANDGTTGPFLLAPDAGAEAGMIVR
ncbi:methionyl-tRNA synthetase [mine drainage metagenome]|uniref:Methionine--tRNA ligase n=1 Tax=mine drainage metagenome TaxID=410659 RepID=T1AUP4_9ZZZZ